MNSVDDIESVQYTSIDEDTVLINGHEFVPVNEDNADWQRVLLWQARGNVIEPALTAAEALGKHKDEVITANRKEAGQRIAALFGTVYGSRELYEKELNGLMRYNDLREKELAGTLSNAEQAEIDSLRATKDRIADIRAAENAAAAQIAAAASESEVDAVVVAWP